MSRTTADIDTLDETIARARIAALVGGHHDPNVAAADPGLSGRDCEVLARFGTPSQRRGLARNPVTTSHALDWLAEHHRDTWSEVAGNPNVSLAALRRIHSVPKTIDTMAEALAWCAGRRHLQIVAAGNPNTPPAIVEQLAGEDSGDTRRAAAQNPVELSRETLDKLAADPDWGVRAALAANPKTPPGILERLAADPIIGVREAVQTNPFTPPELEKRLRKARPMEPATMVLVAVTVGILFIMGIIVLGNIAISCYASP